MKVGCNTSSNKGRDESNQANPAVDTQHLSDDDMYGLLFKSCKEGDGPTMKGILINEICRIDINYRLNNDETLLYAASYNRQLELVAYLLKQYAGTIDVNIRTGWASHPLHPAAWSGETQLVKNLLDAGADINCQDRSHMSPLGYAAAHGHLETVKLLVARNANMNRELEDNFTALDFAIKERHAQVIDFLTESGAVTGAGAFN